MSGGFFRGTSADQDTRFSNKQAKLLKSQKFAPELDHLVDVSKVKMDVIRPWIATRATELLGFEDEVLINFVYGLLEGKEVDGKQIQIQLTGFMEKNTGKFMKELWSLLLSAQTNASGIPQQFLDAKEEELKKKKAETDRITQEIHKRKERGGWETEQDRNNRMDGKVDILGLIDSSRNADSGPDASLKQNTRRSTSYSPKDDVEVARRQGSRINSRSVPSPVRSSSKSFSNSRSYSQEKHSSRSPSVSPRRSRRSVSHERRYISPPRRSASRERRYRSPPRRSLSCERRYRSPPRCSVSHERRYRSPPRRSVSPRQISRSPRRRSPHFRRRSTSRRHYKSPSPVRHRTPERRRSPSPLRYRSPPSPHHRFPSYNKSPFHARRRSPSPSRRRSPFKRRTPTRHRSPSPMKRKSPPPTRSPRRQRNSPIRSKIDLQGSPPQRNRNHSPFGSHSPPNQTHSHFSRDLDTHANGLESKKSQDEHSYRRSPAHHHSSESEEAKRTSVGQKRVDSVSRKQPISLRSPQRDPGVQSDALDKELAISATIENSESPMNPKAIERRMRTSSRSPSRQSRRQKAVPCSPEKSKREDETSHASYVDHSHEDIKGSSRLLEEIGYDHKKQGGESFSPGSIHDNMRSSGKGVSPQNKKLSNWQPLLKSPALEGSHRYDDKKIYYKDDKGSSHHHSDIETKKKVNQNIKDTVVDSETEDEARYRQKKIEKGNKRPTEAMEDEAGYDSQIDEKEAKKRRREEKRLHKEEKRRKREERHRKKEERRAGKKAKHIDTVNPPDYKKRCNASDGSDVDARTRDTDEAESQQKKLEIELREKALESLRAKKAVTH